MPALSSEHKLPPIVEVMGLPVRSLLVDELIELVVGRARDGQRTRIGYCNAHTTNMALDDAQLNADLAAMDILYADGAAIVWASQLGEHTLPERMTAAGFFNGFIEKAAAARLKLFLLGGEAGIAETAAISMQAVDDGVGIVGTQHGFFEYADAARVVETINDANPDVVLVGLSTPRQERWVQEYADRLHAPILWCVGALFDYYAGREQRGPSWLCDHGGEWLYRLWEDPAGKWKRYLLGNPLFVSRAAKWGWERRRHKHEAKNDITNAPGGDA